LPNWQSKCGTQCLTEPAAPCGRLGLPHGPDLVPQCRRLSIAIEFFEQESETLGGLDVLTIDLQRVLVGIDGLLILPLLFTEYTALYRVFDTSRIGPRGF